MTTIIFLSITLITIYYFFKFLLNDHDHLKIFMTFIIMVVYIVLTTYFFYDDKKYLSNSAIVQTCLSQETNNIGMMQCTYTISWSKND